MKKQYCIKDIISPDIIGSLENYCPIPCDCFSITLQIIVGIQDQDGGESFCIDVCTPKYLIENFKQSDMIWGRHYLFVFEYNFSMIKKKIDEYFESINNGNWDDISEKMARIGLWEFEDYK